MSRSDPDLVARVRAGHMALMERIAAAGGDPDAVTVVAVTKGFGPEAVHAALEVGIADIGENYAQEVRAKWPEVSSRVAERAPRLHFVGRLQTNKIRQLAGIVDLYQSVDRPSLMSEIGRRHPGAAVLVQVNVSDEPTKGGCRPDEARSLVEAGLEAGLSVEGLMAVAGAEPDVAVRRQFDRLVGLSDDLGLAVRSIGMTADLELAVAAGSTMVRVGTALFGPRPGR